MHMSPVVQSREAHHGPSSRTGAVQNRTFVFAVDVSSPVSEALSEAGESTELELVSFATLQEYLAHSRTDECSCLILDLCSHHQTDFKLQCRLAAEASPPVIFTCQHGDVTSIVRALKNSPSELLIPPITPSDLVAAIVTSLAKDRARRIQRAERESLQRRHSLLTPREREALPLVVGGLLNKQAASMLGISEVTFQIHRSQLMRKMQAHSVADLVRMAARLRIPYWVESSSNMDVLSQIGSLEESASGPRPTFGERTS